ncbi:hypothetical protein PUN71_021745 [Arthrobacter sp. NQ7]|uniref:hypothetical protein n=1 Tax=Arthrobacter sp. NQ7 TaxID=3032303 RepID=UPI00240F685B|nr:hypothetical protein [Arthrobacter sp. NQ7]MDJ0459836.1 hypothetical protein [Arthrobacter sp. NQ7]
MPEETAPSRAAVPPTPPAEQPDDGRLTDEEKLTVSVTVEPSFEERLFLRCRGTCPDCGTAIAYDHPLAAISDGLAIPTGAPAGDHQNRGLATSSVGPLKRLWLLLKWPVPTQTGIDENIVLTCQPDATHTGGHPSDAAGQPPAPLADKIKAAWLIHARKLGDDEYNPNYGLDTSDQRRPTADDYEIEQSLSSAAKNALSTVRKAAGDWQTGLAGLLAVVTAATFFKGADSVGSYQDPLPAFFLVLGILVLVTGGAGLVSLLAAAHGEPAAATYTDVASAKNLLGWNTRLARRAHRQFRDGQFMTVLAALFVAISAMLLAYGPRAAADKPTVLLSYRDSSQNDLIVTGCGKLIEATTTSITYQPGNAEKQSFPANKLVAQTNVAHCP